MARRGRQRERVDGDGAVAFPVDERSTRLPHSAFRGQAPDKMYNGTGDGVLDELEAKREKARARRMAANRAAACAVCSPLVVGDK